MTHRPDYTLSEELLEHLTEEGLDALPEMIRIVINTAMQAERLKYLGVAAPYERSPQRQDYANGYKPKSVKTRAGEITFSVPQVRGGDFYPGALEKGLRSERALTLTLALAEMYVLRAMCKGSQRAKWLLSLRSYVAQRCPLLK